MAKLLKLGYENDSYSTEISDFSNWTMFFSVSFSSKLKIPPEHTLEINRLMIYGFLLYMLAKVRNTS